MTKANELAVLDTAIAALGSASYLGPWLASVRADVEASMRSDLEPAGLPSEARRDAETIVSEARIEAARVREAAHLDIVRQREETARDIERARESARSLLRRAAATI